MFYPILLSMIAATAAVPAQEPEPTIRVTLSNEGQYLPGDRAKVQVITRDDGYLLVLQVSPEGRLRVLFPLDPTDDSYVKGGKRYLLLGRNGREGFTVDVPGTGVIFAAVSLDPWRFSGYVQNAHWDYNALNTTTFDDTEPQLVALAQGIAGGRFDYDVVNYTVASQVAVTEEPTYVSGGVTVVDGCYGCAAPVGVIYGTGYYNTWGLYDPWYYSPYYNYGPYYPAWAYGPTWGWGWGWGCYGYYCNGGGWGNYYPPYATAVPYAPYAPYQKKQWDRTWNGEPVPYRPRGYTATNTVVGAVPGIGVQQHASFRDRTWGGGPIGGGSVLTPSAVPVSKGTSGNNAGGRRRDAAPAATTSRPSAGATPSSGAARPSGTTKPSGTTRPSGTARPPSNSPPKGVPSRQRAEAAPMSPTSNPQYARPEARPSRPAGERPTAVAAPAPYKGPSTFERRALTPAPSAQSSQPTGVAPVSRAAPDAPAATRATGTGRSSEPVLRRREPDQSAAAAAPAPRQENSGRDPSLGRSYGSPPSPGVSPPSMSPPSQPSSGVSGGGYSGGGYSGGGGRATSTPPSAPPSSSAPPPSAVPSGGGRRR